MAKYGRNKTTEWLRQTGGAGSSFNQTIQDEGVDLTQRAKVNFVGAGVSATDTAGVTTVTITGGGAGSGISEELAIAYAVAL